MEVLSLQLFKNSKNLNLNKFIINGINRGWVFSVNRTMLSVRWVSSPPEVEYYAYIIIIYLSRTQVLYGLFLVTVHTVNGILYLVYKGVYVSLDMMMIIIIISSSRYIKRVLQYRYRHECNKDKHNRCLIWVVPVNHWSHFTAIQYYYRERCNGIRGNTYLPYIIIIIIWRPFRGWL